MILLLWPTLAHAAARVVAPRGWGESAMAAPEAQRRASDWQAALGLRLTQVVSTPEGDRFAETVAVFERSTPVPAEAFANEAAAIAALSTVVANIVGTEPPEQSELQRTSDGAQLAWGRWIVDDLSYECVLAPSGGTASVVITAVLASQADSHRSVLANVFRELEGVSAPMPSFSLSGWRIASVIVWLAVAFGLHAVMLPFGDSDHDHRQAGTRAAGIGLALVVLGTGAAGLLLRGRELALVHAGSSVAGLAVFIGVSGLTVVGLHFLIAARFDRGPVRSAPSSGAFASGIYSNADLMRSSITRSGMFTRVDQPEPSSDGSPSPIPSPIIVDESERE